MTLPLVQFFTKKLTSNDSPNKPMFTSIPTSVFGGSSRARIGSNANFDAQQFWNWFENSPELVGTLSIPIIDIMGERPIWTKPDGTPLSKRQRMKAEKFWMSNRGKETLKAMLFDIFVHGDGYLWKGKPTRRQINAAVKEVLTKYDSIFSDLQVKEVTDIAVQDEDLKTPRRFDYVAGEGVRIIHDEYEIIGYEQEANGLTSKFKPDEIIHMRYFTIRGRVNGFSPAKSLAMELMLIKLVKENMSAFLENGGTPNKLYVLPKEIANSKNHQFLINQLMKYKKIQNRGGSLVFTGELDVKDLQGNPKDLEYKDLALYMTSNIAFAFGIPITRIPFLIGSSATGGDGGGGLSESGYWNKISDFQDTIEDLLNGQLFHDLGWAIKLKRGYKQDEVRESQVESMHTDSIIKMQQIFEKQGKQVKTNKILELMDWNEEDIEEMDMSLMETQNNSLQNQNQQSQSELNKPQDKQFRDNVKKNSANAKGISESIQNP